MDFHFGAEDTGIGRGLDPTSLAEQLRRMDLDFVQIDTKGGPGYTSYFAKTPGTRVAPGLEADLVRIWRDATRAAGLPLHGHWIAMSDGTTLAAHPEWVRVESNGRPAGDRLCYRSPFVETMMIPQLIELARDWELDGLWIDAQAWCMQPCWCDRCRLAWEKSGNSNAPPLSPSDPAWSDWMMFHRSGFDNYVRNYVCAVKAAVPGCRICDNWSLTLSQPGPPQLPVDFVSSDDAAPYGVDNIRLEARFASTRPVPHWDFMQWLFYAGKVMHDATIPQAVRPLEHLQQEAAYILSLGGGHQIYEQPTPLRDGSLIDWRVDRIGEFHRWCRPRGLLCRGSESWRDVVVLNSEQHFSRHATRSNLLWSFDQNNLHGAVNICTDLHRGVDVMDEWALRKSRNSFSTVVIPEQPDISEALIAELKAWVAGGGRLVLSGARAMDRWGADFLGIQPAEVTGASSWHVPVKDVMRCPIWSPEWRLVTVRDARAMGFLSTSDDLVRGQTRFPAATQRDYGSGRVTWLPCDAFSFYARTRYPILREFLVDVLGAAAGPPPVQVIAPLSIEVVLRVVGPRRIINLINRGSGWSTGPNDYAVENIPPSGPVRLCIPLAAPPKNIRRWFESDQIEHASANGILRITVDSIAVHDAVSFDQE